LARLRDEYDQFVSRGVEILAVGPNPSATFEQYWSNEHIPFIGLPDPEHKVALLYRQEVNMFRLGRMPLSCVVDAMGMIRYAHYGTSMRDIPANEELFQVIDTLNNSSN
jgi:peroxiredoxin Q/BCP